MLNRIDLHMVEIYPREGTETFHFRAMSTTLIVEIYLREGTETPARI